MAAAATSSSTQHGSSPSIVMPNAEQIRRTVKNSGEGLRPVSILRKVSTEIEAREATSTIVREPRAVRSAAPKS